jgi:coenzyme PQQ precursor peptide PqqA
LKRDRDINVAICLKSDWRAFAHRNVKAVDYRPCGTPAVGFTLLLFGARIHPGARQRERETTMAWTTPTLVEICIGLEINGYLPAEF